MYGEVFSAVVYAFQLFFCLYIFNATAVLQKRRMRRKGGWGQAGGPIQILRACQEITAGKGRTM